MGLILPSPPNSFERAAYLKTRRLFICLFSGFSISCLLAGLWLFVLAHPSFYAFGIVAAILSFYLLLSFFVGALGRDFSLHKHNNILGSELPGASVDVFLPCCGEPLEILANTYTYVAQMSGNKKVYVLDDGHSEAVRDLAEAFGFFYIRRESREYKKAGNLRHAFNKTYGDFILILDADFCPAQDFLAHTLPYFNNEQVAIVQTPQFFRVLDSQNWIEKAAGQIQELFYRLVQVNRNTWGGAICVGTCAVYRRAALAPLGGTFLIEYSEDVHTGMALISRGFKLVYLPLNLACGICPDNLPAFFSQQYRWAMGSISLFLSRDLFWKVKLTLMQRICFLSGMFYYIATGIGIFITPLPAIAVLLLRPEMLLWQNILLSVPSFLFGTVFIYFWSVSRFGVYSLKLRQVAYHAHLFALVHKIRGNLMPWVATGAVKRNATFQAYLALVYYWNLTVLVLIVGLISLRVGQGFNPWNCAPTALFTAFNFYIATSLFKDFQG